MVLFDLLIIHMLETDIDSSNIIIHLVETDVDSRYIVIHILETGMITVIILFIFWKLL